MALINCPECGREVSDKAISCPSCGHPIEKYFADQERERQRIKAIEERKKIQDTPMIEEPKTESYPVPERKAKNYGFIPLLISAAIGTFYVCFSLLYWSTATTGTADVFESIGTGIATSLVMPHLICAVLALIFNILGMCMTKPGFALTGAILYAVSMVLFWPYFMFVIIEMILSFVGFARMNKNK